MYRHTQIATALLVFLSFIAGFVALAWYLMGTDIVLMLFAGLLALIALCFYSMTVEVSGTELRWSLGPGIGKNAISLADIERVDPVTNSLLHGLGIRITHDGWVYAVSGFSAVAVTLKDGTKYRLGTDDQKGLLAALRVYIPEPEPATPEVAESEDDEWDEEED